jgi:hypothetical protein
MGGKVTKSRKSSNVRSAAKDAGASTANDGKNPIQPIPAEGEESGHLDQIRDIIFGKQMAAYEERFAQLEQRITTQIDTLRRDNEAQLKSMQATLKQSSDAFSKLLKDEQSDRGREGKALSREISDAQKTLSAAIDALDERQQKDVAGLGEKLSALSSEVSDEMHIQQVEASKQLEEAVRQLDDAKLARKALSRLLMDMADRLADEPE